MGSTTSWRINSKLGLLSRWETLCFWEVKKLSRQMISWPWATRRSQRWEPRKPAPPVTRIRLSDDVELVAIEVLFVVCGVLFVVPVCYWSRLSGFAPVVFNDFCEAFL